MLLDGKQLRKNNRKQHWCMYLTSKDAACAMRKRSPWKS